VTYERLGPPEALMFMKRNQVIMMGKDDHRTARGQRVLTGIGTSTVGLRCQAEPTMIPSEVVSEGHWHSNSALFCDDHRETAVIIAHYCVHFVRLIWASFF
jgi:hypothetical protein